jgi:two-component system LytT family response regulator
MTGRIRVLVADDERPARAFLLKLLRAVPDVAIVAEAADGAEAVTLIEEHRPDVAFLDLQMPEVDGLEVVRLLRRGEAPLIVFVTAYDEYAVRAFEMNAVDYLTKPVTEKRLQNTMVRIRERLGRSRMRHRGLTLVQSALQALDRSGASRPLTRIPVRHHGDIVLVPVNQLSTIVADGELLHLTTSTKARYTVRYRLKDLEARLDPSRFVRLSRGALAAIDQIVRVTPMPGGTYSVALRNGDLLDASRLQSRLLRERLLLL